MTHAQILVIESEKPVAEKIQRILDHLGYTVTGIVSSGEDAITTLSETRPDVILINIELTGNRDGIDVAKNLKSRFDGPIIYLTDYGDDVTLQRADITEPFEYIVKPVKEREIHIAIEIALYKKSIARKLHEAEAQKQALSRQLQEAGQHKNNFISSMSHELRTPLNAMIGYTSLTLNALKESLSPKHLQNLIKAEQSARTLLQLINDVLDFSKIEAGKLEVFIEDIELSDLLEDVIITAEGLLSEKPVELKSDFPSELPIIESDYTRLKQIFDNLVGNAIKFTSKGYVAVRAIPKKNERIVRIEVEDTGCGISSEVVESIFELFRQVDGSITKKFKGTGLGLAITKRLSDMLGIAIGVQSKMDKGTMFLLDIPLKFRQVSQDSISPQKAASEVPLPSESSPLSEVPPPSSPKISLYTGKQDEAGNELKALVFCFCGQEICSILNRHLVGLPLEVQPVTTISECVEKGKHCPVWTIILESDENGFEILMKLKNEPSLCHVPIIMSSTETAKHGFHVDIAEYIEKPVTTKKLIEALLRITKVQRGDILVVDDDVTLRRLYGHILSEAGYTPHVAENGIEALDILSKHPSFQVIILDLMMPAMNGFQLLDRIQQHKVWRRIPVIVITGKTLSAAEKKLLHNGVQLLLSKEKFPVKEIPKQIESIVHSVTLAGTRSILIVDDNESNLDLMANVFTSVEYTVYKAKSGSEGIKIAQEVLPDTILMDIAMPDMDGFEATQILKQHAETADITVIACSAFSVQEYKERAFQVGCEGYITKPIEPNRLVEQVTKFMLISKIKKKLAQHYIIER